MPIECEYGWEWELVYELTLEIERVTLTLGALREGGGGCCMLMRNGLATAVGEMGDAGMKLSRQPPTGPGRRPRRLR